MMSQTNPFRKHLEGKSSNTEPTPKENPFKKLIAGNQSKNISEPAQEFPDWTEEKFERETERNMAQQLSRIGEIGLGFPGDALSLIKNFTDLPVGGLLGGFLPTSEKLREVSEKGTLGFTKPQSELEERVGELQQDIASFLLPGSKTYSLARNIGIPVVANLAKEGVKYLGGDKSADAAKIGTMITLDLMNLRAGGAKKFATSLFNESEKLVPSGAKLKSSNLPKSLSILEKSLESGGSRPSTEKALKKIGEIQNKIKDGEIEVRELLDFRKSINEIKTEIGGYEVQIPKTIKKKISANLDLVKKEVIEGLNEYGSKQNPEFLKLNKSANEAYGAYEASDKMASFIKKTVKDSIRNPGVKTLLGLGGLATMGKGIAIGAPPAIAGYEAYKVLHQVIQSPTLRKYYGNILKGASSGNAAQVSRNAKALEKEFEKDSD